MKVNKRNIYIVLFAVLYILVSVVSLLHSFAFFELANSTPKAVMLGICFEIGQVAVLMSLLTSKKEQSRIMPWCLMFILTAVQIIGNIFSSYKYLILNSPDDLKFFKEPIFVWTSLPDNITTVIITYIVGAILPVIALCMTAMVSNYIQEGEDDNEGDNENILEADINNIKMDNEMGIESENTTEQSEYNNENTVEEPKYIQDPTLGCDVFQTQPNNETQKQSEGFVNL